MIPKLDKRVLQFILLIAFKTIPMKTLIVGYIIERLTHYWKCWVLTEQVDLREVKILQSLHFG